MKNFLAILLLTVSTSSMAAVYTSGNYTEHYSVGTNDAQSVALVKYINGDYPGAHSVFAKLNPFKSQYSITEKLERSLVDSVDANKNGRIDDDGIEDVHFAELYATDIAFGDTNNDGHLDPGERFALSDIANEAEKSKGASFGCDAVVAVGSKVDVLGMGEVSIAQLSSLYRKCVGQ